MDEFKELEKEEVIKRFASLEFNRFLDYYKMHLTLTHLQMISAEMAKEANADARCRWQIRIYTFVY
jgi:hypothetical protein